MGILVDSTSSGQIATGTTGTSVTISHTCTGSNLCLVACVNFSGASTTASVTYNGVSMTANASKTVPPSLNWASQQFYLVNPATGTHNIVITTSVASTIMGFGISATGVDQTSPIDSSTTGNGTSLSLSSTLTTVGSGILMIDSAGLANATSTLTKDAAQTLVATSLSDTTAGRTGGASYILNTGTHAMTWTISGGTNRNWSQQILALNPASTAAPGQFFAFF